MRIILFAICAAILIGLAYHALSAPQPFMERPSFRPQTAREAKNPIHRCMTLRKFILAQRLPNGKAIPVMVAIVAVPCQ